MHNFLELINEISPHVEYSFTELGKDMMPIFYSVMVFGFKYENDIKE